jgi:hypothetical protein
MMKVEWPVPQADVGDLGAALQLVWVVNVDFGPSDPRPLYLIATKQRASSEVGEGHQMG